MNALHRRSGFTSAQELYEALEADGITIGLTTVYRTLHALDRSGQLDVVRDKSGERLYRPRPADGHRHYLVCRDCGLSREVEAGVVERWAEKRRRRHGLHRGRAHGGADRRLRSVPLRTQRPGLRRAGSAGSGPV
ncbi:Fur family transcriptional regulator [Streptomyces sp. PB17]|uniref:Fur family transcriptional regulator n=1 Tax=Streptomyces sp. PB17 TaxID=3384158 RepID=UPI0038B68A21